MFTALYLNLDLDSNPGPKLITDSDPNLQIISDPAGSVFGSAKQWKKKTKKEKKCELNERKIRAIVKEWVLYVGTYILTLLPKEENIKIRRGEEDLWIKEQIL
jgi:hypothetical protein